VKVINVVPLIARVKGVCRVNDCCCGTLQTCPAYYCEGVELDVTIREGCSNPHAAGDVCDLSESGGCVKKPGPRVTSDTDLRCATEGRPVSASLPQTIPRAEPNIVNAEAWSMGRSGDCHFCRSLEDTSPTADDPATATRARLRASESTDAAVVLFTVDRNCREHGRLHFEFSSRNQPFFRRDRPTGKIDHKSTGGDGE
jgi:hypothetical protein